MAKNLLNPPITTAEKLLNPKAKKADFLLINMFLKETADFL